MTTFQRTNSADPDFQNLVKLLDEDLASRNGDEQKFYEQFNKLANIRNVIVCYTDGEPVGCGAFKEYEPTRVEIKRMYVKPACRGKGIAFGILKELELWAAELNYSATILETGTYNSEAIRLYEKAGYTIIENFGQYAGVEASVCMTKAIF